jgi:predicted nucleic acid-binding protein
MIVVDSNVIAYLYLPGEYAKAAERLLEWDADWHAPVLWRSEVRNILTAYLRRGLLTFEQVLAVQKEAELFLMGAEHEPDSVQVLSLVRMSDCTAYDCEFVALANALGVRLVTMDKKLLRNFPHVAEPLTDF